MTSAFYVPTAPTVCCFMTPRRIRTPCSLWFFLPLILMLAAPKLCVSLFFIHCIASLIAGVVHCATDGCAFSKRTNEAGAVASHVRSRDMSSVRMITSGKKTRVHICAPGLRTEDLDVTIVQNVMHVKGERHRGTTTFGIDRRIELPSDADGDTATATHADGVLTVTVDTKAATHVRIAARGDVEDDRATTG